MALDKVPSYLTHQFHPESIEFPNLIDDFPQSISLFGKLVQLVDVFKIIYNSQKKLQTSTSTVLTSGNEDIA